VRGRPADARGYLVRKSGARRSGMTIAVCAGRQRGADDGARLVGIFDAVEQNDQADLALDLFGVVEEAFKRGRRARGSDGYDSLDDRGELASRSPS